ncbi:hypothetical protein Tco_0091503 [Tanacetum coccineum]
MKWCRMSMCLDRECWTLLQLKAMALLLSQYRGILLNRKPYSLASFCKEHFVGVQTALFKEVKVMEEIFDQMNDEKLHDTHPYDLQRYHDLVPQTEYSSHMMARLLQM